MANNDIQLLVRVKSQAIKDSISNAAHSRKQSLGDYLVMTHEQYQDMHRPPTASLTTSAALSRSTGIPESLLDQMHNEGISGGQDYPTRGEYLLSIKYAVVIANTTSGVLWYPCYQQGLPIWTTEQPEEIAAVIVANSVDELISLLSPSMATIDSIDSTNSHLSSVSIDNAVGYFSELLSNKGIEPLVPPDPTATTLEQIKPLVLQLKAEGITYGKRGDSYKLQP